jgi:arginase family enzyme
MGPSALRIACLGAAISAMGYTHAREEDIAVPAMETRSLEDSEAHLLMEYCADSRRLVSMEVVELNPFLDHGTVSAERTQELITNALGKSIL